LSGVFEWHQSRGVNYQTIGYKAPVKMLKMLSDDAYASFDGEIGRVEYPNALTARADTFFSLGGTYGRKLGDRWNARLTYMYKRNASTDGDAAYSKHLFQLEAEYAVF
jgi:hypothetical protein